ncbi:MAG: organic solvent tolerance protein OstA [Spirochaetales bacterium]|nr:organic solvent tolerance protein OstA [Spirochaetales bacterium]
MNNLAKKSLWAVFLIFLSITLISQEAPTKEEEETEKEKFEFSGDSTSINLKEGQEKTTLRGNARIISGSTEIKADIIEITGQKFEYAECKNNITVTNRDKGLFIKCNQLNFDRKKNISTIVGFVEMIDKENNLIVRGNYLQDDGEADITIIQIGVRIIKDDIICRSEFARFNRETKELELTGSPFVKKGNDEYRAKRIILNTETDEIRLEGKASAKVSGSEEE